MKPTTHLEIKTLISKLKIKNNIKALVQRIWKMNLYL